MEEITKNTNYSPKKIKVKDLTIKEKQKDKKEKTPPKKKYSSISDKLYKFDTTYKTKELNKFKDDILSYFRERDYYYLEKLSDLKSQTEITDKNLDNLSDVMQKNFNNFLSTQAEITTSFDKLKNYDAFVNRANDKLISHEIRINCLREDLTKTIQKYDKIYLDNLEVPGYIGRCSKYANCKIFFTEIIRELDKFNTYREKNIIDLCTYKERLENIIKTFQSLVDNNNDSQIKYITKLNDKTNKNLLETLEEKITNVRVDNSRFATDLINKTSELNELFNKMNIMKENLLKEFNIKTDEFNKKSNETLKSFNEYKVEYATIRKKFLELADFIRSGKFSKNFGSIYGKKEINSITKKLVKETKESIDAKDVKLMNNIEEVEKMEFKPKNNSENKNNINNKNNLNNTRNNVNINNRFSKSQNNFYQNNNIGKKKNFGFGQNNQNKNLIEKNANSIDSSNNEMKVHQGLLFYLGNNISDNDSLKNSKRNNLRNNLINENDKIKNLKNSIIPIEKNKNQVQNEINENKDKNNNNNKDLANIKIVKEKNGEKKNTFSDELSLSESYLSNINNSINTFSTTNEKNNSISSLINVNNKNCNKFNLLEEDLKNNDKIIKELASELEQSTAKVNKLASNKKEIEENFKSICNKIEPINLKLKNVPLEKIPEQKTITGNNKDKDQVNNIINKSDQNSTVLSNNLNSNTNNSTNNNNTHNEHNDINNSKDEFSIKKNKVLIKNNKLKALVDPNEKIEENNITIKSNKSKNISKINTNETLINDTINFSIDKKMNVYDKKLIDLESNTRDQLQEVIKQIDIIKKSFSYWTSLIKREKSSSSIKLSGFNTSNNLLELSNGNGNFFNNENKNILNLTSNNFNKKSPKNEMNPKLGSNKKLIQAMEDINFSDNLFYNGKYYFNIKDIFEKNKNSNYERKKLLKQIDNKFLEENASRNRSNSSTYKNGQFKSNNTSFGGGNENRWSNLKRFSSGNIKYNKAQKPQSEINPFSISEK